MVYTAGERERVTITVTGGTYIWPAPAAATDCLRCRSWHDMAQSAAEIAERLQDEPLRQDRF